MKHELLAMHWKSRLNSIATIGCLLILILALPRKSIPMRLPHVETPIEKVLLQVQLAAQETSEYRDGLDDSNKIYLSPEGPVLNDLLHLARSCDNQIYQCPSENELTNFSSKSQALKMLGASNDPVQNAAAAILALGSLESAIRLQAGFTTGKAPLLSNMIGLLPDSNKQIRHALECLLLPKGLNLRNLLWHGFCGSLPRPWLSLVLVLEHDIMGAMVDESAPKIRVRTHKEQAINPNHLEMLQDQIDQGQELLLDPNTFQMIRNWLPESHRGLLDLAESWTNQYPSCALALMTILLEHGLRLEWCHVNQLPLEIKARVDRYYVTLDGHGQRNQHDLILHPTIIQDEPRTNALVNHLGAGTISFLSDLFCSVSGPNIRAAISHGLLDKYINRELEIMTSREVMDSEQDATIRPALALVVLALHQTATMSCIHTSSFTKDAEFQYVPNFSYTAMTHRSLGALEKELHALHEITSTCIEISGVAGVMRLPSNLILLNQPIPQVISIANEAKDLLQWKSGLGKESIFLELKYNQILASQQAVRVLLDDICRANQSYAAIARDAAGLLTAADAVDACSRQRKRALRQAAFSQVAFSVYSFTGLVALVSLRSKLKEEQATSMDDNDMLKLVERSRMVVSSTENFLSTNAERVFKPIEQFSKAKVVKLFIEHYAATN